MSEIVDPLKTRSFGIKRPIDSKKRLITIPIHQKEHILPTN